VPGIREFLRGFLVPDEHARPQDHNSYEVHSLYLDTPGLSLFRGTMEGLRNRFKLRIRFYDSDPDHPAFLEIKRRLDQVILKERARVSREGVALLLRRGWLCRSHLLTREPAQVAALQNFNRMYQEIQAAGLAYVSYVREAYVSARSNHVRVTFDRQISGARYRPTDSLSPPASLVPVGVRGTVLELKFTDRFPQWMHELVHAFDLWRVSFAKYCKCVEAMGLHRKGLVISGGGAR
jgi:hypothetical protein